MLNTTIGIVGVGGVGGYVAEFICRIGCKKIILFDGDVFVHTNLNRQLFSNSENISKNKAIEAKRQLELINPNQKIEAYDCFIENNSFCLEILSECDLIFSCAVPYETNPASIKNLFFNLIFLHHIPVIDGGITKDGKACASIITEDNLDYFNYIFNGYIVNINKNISELTSVSSLSHMVAIAAGFEVDLAVRFICKKSCKVNEEIHYQCII